VTSQFYLFQINRLAWPHRRRGLALGGVRYAGARRSVGRRVGSVTRLRLAWYGGVFLLLQQRSKHPRELVRTPKASTSIFVWGREGQEEARHTPRSSSQYPRAEEDLFTPGRHPPHQDSAGIAPCGIPPPAQPPPHHRQGEQPHIAPAPLKWPVLTPHIKMGFATCLNRALDCRPEHLKVPCSY